MMNDNLFSPQLAPVSALTFAEMPQHRDINEITPTASESYQPIMPRWIRYLATGKPIPNTHVTKDNIVLEWLPPMAFSTEHDDSKFPINIIYLTNIVPMKPYVVSMDRSTLFDKLFTLPKLDQYMFGPLAKFPIPGENYIQMPSSEMSFAINKLATDMPIYISYRPVVRVLPIDIIVGEIAVYTFEGLMCKNPTFLLKLDD